MKRGQLLFPLYIVITILVVSCTKTGPTGPDGPMGVQGSKGDKGDKGDKGADGTNGTNGTNGTDGTNGTNGTNGADGATGPQGPAGTANVIYSNWFTNDEFSQGWADSTIYSTLTTDPENIIRAIKYAPDITDGILDSGLVLSYVRSVSQISPQLLPWNFSFDDGGGLAYYQMNLVPQVGGILYYMTNQTTHSISVTSFAPGSGFSYRYIIIPGGVLATGRRMNPKAMSYSEVCKTYNIPQ
ncbi:MAG: hypothetical protein ABUT20_01385 [Bacteroidota bacterium]